MAFQIRVVGDLEHPRIEASGEERRLLKPEEYGAVGIDIAHLKRHFANGWGGPEPKNIYTVNEQLPWGDQNYQKYGLEEGFIRRRLIEARLVNTETSPYQATGLAARNNSDREASVHVNTDFSVNHTMSTNWNVNASVTATTSVEVTAGGEAYGGSVKMGQSLSVSAGYGQGGEDSKSEQIGSSAGVQVELPPHTGAQAKLVSSKGSLIIRAKYVLDFGGHLWLDYGRKVTLVDRGSHFFFFEAIPNILAHPVQEEWQTISIDRYFNHNIDIENVEL